MTAFQSATFPQLLRAVTERHREHDALAGPQGTWSYGELERRSARMARALLAQGAGKGTRITVLAPLGPLWLTAFYAGLRIGALVTSASTVATPRELAHIVRHSDAQLVVGVRRYMKHDYAAKLAEALEIDPSAPRTLRLESAPYLRSVWLDDADGIGWAGSAEELLSAADGPDAPSDKLLEAVEREVSPADDAVVIFTSGSTALPKAVVHRQRSVAGKPGVVCELGGYAMEASDRVLSLMPPFWMGGLMAALTVLARGATLVHAESVAPAATADVLVDQRVTRVVGAAPGDKRLAEALEARGTSGLLTTVRGLAAPSSTGGAPARRYPASTAQGSMGMTETFGYHSVVRPDEPTPAERWGTVGQPVLGIESRVVDLVTGQDTGPGREGELWLRGSTMMSGYYKVERGDTFTPDGYLRTKDRVVKDEDGCLYFFGRLSDMLKSKGANVSRLEVEEALNRLPEVDLALVVGLPDEEYGQLVAAAVVPAPGARPTAGGLQVALRRELSGYKVPRRIVFITPEDITRTSTGKVKLADVAEMVRSRLDAAPASAEVPR
ncbi:class I adenylate-forming enzyme family protein [Streptomyces chartreusis]|uniref:class I adenylate-forming enzyme family protein n=1 Tax=Streptomyces chartreusis TaxID=1969 RepID=UPI0036344428